MKKNRTDLYRAVLFFLLLLFFFFPHVIVGKASLNPAPLCPSILPEHEEMKHPVVDAGESAWFNGPWNSLSRRLIRSWELPLWNPHSGCGTPLLANMISSPFYPLKVLLYVLPEEEAWDIFFLVRIFVAALFAYLFLRLLGMDFLPAILGGTIFSFTGYFMLYINMMQVNVDILIPALLYFLELLARRGWRRDFLGVAGVVWLSLLGGMPQSAFFLLLFGFFYFLVRVLLLRKERGEPRFLFHQAARYLGAHVLGFGISLPVLLPFLEYWREGYTLHVEGRGLTFYPPLTAVTVLDPFYYESITAPHSYSTLFPYLGVIAFLLAVVSLFRKGPARGTFLFFAIYALFVVLKTFGFPLVNWVGRLPLFSISTFDEYNTPIFMFLMAALAARGCQDLACGKPGLRRAFIGAGLTVGILALFRILWAVGIFSERNVSWLVSGKSLPIVHWVPLLFLALGLIPFFLRRISSSLGLLPPFACFVVVVLELYTYLPKERLPVGDPYPVPPFARFLEERGGQGRPRCMGMDGVLFPNTAAVLGLDDIRAKGPLWVKRYERLIRRHFFPDLADGFTGSERENFQLPRKLLHLLGVRFLLSRSFFHEVLPFREILLQEGVAHLENGDFPLRSLKRERVLGRMSVGGFEREVLLASLPAAIEVPVALPDCELEMRTSVGVAASGWQRCGKEGRMFRIEALARGREDTLFEAWLRPLERKEDRLWRQILINLSRYRGGRIVLRFTVSGGAGAVKCGWGVPKIVAISGSPYSLIYDQEIKIFENSEALPRTFVVFRGEVVSGEEEALERIGEEDFQPGREAVLEEEIPWEGIRAGRNAAGKGEALLRHYSPHRVKLDASLDREGLLVFTDVFFPGWKVLVNGEPREILRVDYTFRGVLLEKGEHEVEFVYRPSSFQWGVVLMGLTILAFAIHWIRAGRVRS